MILGVIRPNHNSPVSIVRKEPQLDFSEPIPVGAGDVEGWKEIPFGAMSNWARNDVVPVGPFTNYSDIFTSSVYYGEHSNSPYRQHSLGEDTLITQFMRQSTANRLRKAQSLLPDTKFLVVFDAYRPLAVQQKLYESYFKEMHVLHPAMTEEEISAETQKYVSLPSIDRNRPSPHNTGGAVDVAVVELGDDDAQKIHCIDRALDQWDYPDEDIAYMMQMERAMIMRRAILLDFGTPFDNGTERAALRAYEYEDSAPTRNRRLLYHVMTKAGFAAYEHEWWHFNDPKTQMGARALRLSRAYYRGTKLTKKNIKHEKMRRDHYEGVNIIQCHIDMKGSANEIIGAHNISKPLALVAIAQSYFGGIISSPEFTLAERIAPRE